MVLQTQHIVRLDNMQSLVDAERAYQLDPGLHVFEMEQNAVEREKAAVSYSGQRTRPLTLSPEAVALLDKAAAEFDQLGRLILCGVIRLQQQSDSSWTTATDVPQLQALDDRPLADLWSGFVVLVQNDAAVRARVKDLLAQCAPDYMRRTELQLQVDVLVQDPDPACQDIAICIAWSLENS